MTKKKWNVLVFPGGMENGLEIQKSLRYCKEISLFSASSDVMNHAFFVYRDNAIIRDTRNAGWIEDLNEVIERNSIDLVYPANSYVIDRLSEARNEIKAPVLLPDAEVIRITRSKKRTMDLLSDIIPTPRVYHAAGEIETYPVFVKPDDGYGAIGTHVIETPAQAAETDFSSNIVEDYLPGREYSVDCFSDKNGRLLFSGARERSRIRMGTSMHADIVDPSLEARMREYAEKILSRIPVDGAWFFQVKEDGEGTLRLLEIDVRIAGTMCFNRARGVNFPMLSVFQFMGIDVSVMVNPVQISLDRCLKNRFIIDCDYDAVYVDLDDTLVVHNKLNLEMTQFLYQCVNAQKRIVLITKYLGDDVHGYLKTWRVSELFDEIIHLREEQNKAEFIKEKKAIYIDDSFSQRYSVHTALGIPTFDASMVEALLDDRV